MISKVKKAQKGPSWIEVGLGAALSVILGVVLGAAYLVTKPVQTVKDIPKDAPSGAVYYIEGVRDFNKAAVVEEKRKSLTDGESISVQEGELNAFIGSVAKPAPTAKQGDKSPPPADQKLLTPGTLNVRIRSGTVQFANPVAYNVYGFTGTVIVQATGTFSRHGGQFEFDPESIYVGGCPIQHFLFVRAYVLKKLLFTLPVPDDLAAAWAKASDVSVVGNTLQVKMP
jgi:hypothetical protein